MVTAEASSTEKDLLMHGAGLPVQGLVRDITFGPQSMTFDEQTGERVEVAYSRLTTRPGGWSGEGLLLEWDSAQGPRTVLLQDPERFQGLVDALPNDMRKLLKAWRTDVRRNRRLLHVGLVLVITFTLLPLFAVSILMLNADGIVRSAVDRIPVSWEQQLGQQAVRDMFLKDRARLEGPAAARFDAVTATLLEHVETPYTWNVMLVDDGRANAMAFPGGTIVVWTGLLREMRSENELAGVLAHEIQHVALRHSLQQTVHDMGMRTALGLVLLGEGTLGVVTTQVASMLTSLSYSRQQELEADAAAAALLEKTPWDASGLTALLHRLDRSSNELPAILSTHPRGNERAAAMQAPRETTTVSAAWQAVLDDLAPEEDPADAAEAGGTNETP